MSQQMKQENTITNQQLLYRLHRLPIVQQCKVSEILAYIGLQLVNKGKALPIGQALRIVRQSKLDKKIAHNVYLPCVNILEGLICMVIYKRKLLNKFFAHPDYEVWNDEHAAPLFDIMFELSKVYKI